MAFRTAFVLGVVTVLAAGACSDDDGSGVVANPPPGAGGAAAGAGGAAGRDAGLGGAGGGAGSSGSSGVGGAGGSAGASGSGGSAGCVPVAPPDAGSDAGAADGGLDAGALDASAPELVSFAADIRPIFEASCGPCHVTDGSAGHNVGGELPGAYLDAVELGPSLVTRIDGGGMPPAYADPPNDCGAEGGDQPGDPGCMTPEEVALVQRWIDQCYPM